MRFGIGDARLQADVRGHDRGRVFCSDGQVVGITEAGDVVADHRTRGARRVQHRRAPGVDRDRHVEARRERLDRGNDPVELLGLPHLRTRTGLHAADVEELGARDDELLGTGEEGVERPRRAAVVERVRRPVEDAHHHRVARDVDRSVTEAQGGIRDDGHAGRP